MVAPATLNGSESPFPGCCDPDGNGFGNIVGPGAPPIGNGPSNGREFSLNPHATAQQIGSGDTIVVRQTNAGVLTQTPTAIDFVFGTVPALSHYDDGQGDSGDVVYPASASTPGSSTNPLAVAAGPSGDVLVTMSFWRPQRRPIPGAGERGPMDIGQLLYEPDIAQQPPFPQPAGNSGPQCSEASETTNDPNLSLESMPPPVGSSAPASGRFRDAKADAPADPANKLTFTVDITKCLADRGMGAWQVGQPLHMEIEADAPSSSGNDHADQIIYFTRKS
jgi:hypothetical protein